MTPRGQKNNDDGDGSVFRIYAKRKDGTTVERWRAEFTMGYDHQGKRVVVQGQGATSRIAKDRREQAKLKHLVLQGQLSRTVLTDKKVALRKETVQQYLEHWFINLDRDEVGDQTRRSYRSKLELHIYPHIGDIPLVLLNESDIKQLFQVTLREKVYDPRHPEKRLGDGAIKNVWKPLSKALTQAEKEGKIATSPMRTVSKPKVEERQDEEIHSWKPQHLLQKLENTPEEVRWLMSFVMGLRMSEKLGITWDCLSLKPSRGKPPTVTIKQQLAWNVSEHGCGKRDSKTTKFPCGYVSSAYCPKQIGGGGLKIAPYTKTKGVRTLPLPSRIHKLLVEQKKSQDKIKKQAIDAGTWKPLPGLEELIFLKEDGSPISQQRENDRWHELCDEFGVPRQRGHLSRHIVATLLAEAEVPPERAQLILGWSSAKMMSTYVHLRAVKHAVEPLQELEALMTQRQAGAKSAKKLAEGNGSTV